MSKEKKATVDLKYPIPTGEQGEGEPITQLTFGRVKAKHLKSMPKEMMEAAAAGGMVNVTVTDMIPVIASLAGLTDEQADEIDMEDLPQISEVVADFFEQYRVTGPESSGQ
jgi:hypothetical protein